MLQIFFQTFWDFGIRRKLSYFLLHLVNMKNLRFFPLILIIFVWLSLISRDVQVTNKVNMKNLRTQIFSPDFDYFCLIVFNIERCPSDKQELSYTPLPLSTKYIVWNIIWFICKSSLWKFYLGAGLLMNLSVHADMIPFPLGLRHEMKWRVGDGILYKLGLTIMLHPGESISRIG